MNVLQREMAALRPRMELVSRSIHACPELKFAEFRARDILTARSDPGIWHGRGAHHHSGCMRQWQCTNAKNHPSERYRMAIKATTVTRDRP
jgi:metal-dependent amidase/aminoacylase/carboxypeptidase family protein